MSVIKKIKRTTKSHTMNWGHVQMMLGILVTGLGFFNPAVFPDLPEWAYGIAAMVAAMITYYLRNRTTAPLEERMKDDTSSSS